MRNVHVYTKKTDRIMIGNEILTTDLLVPGDAKEGKGRKRLKTVYMVED